jgi:hypothetical protein
MPFSKVNMSWKYDDGGRLVEETRDADPTPADGSDDFGSCDTIVGGDYSDVFAYDLAGNRMKNVHGWDANGDGQISGTETVDSTTVNFYDARVRWSTEFLAAVVRRK